MTRIIIVFGVIIFGCASTDILDKKTSQPEQLDLLCELGETKKINDHECFCMVVLGKMIDEEYCEILSVKQSCLGDQCFPIFTCALKLTRQRPIIVSWEPPCPDCLDQQDQMLLFLMLNKMHYMGREMKMSFWVPLIKKQCQDQYWGLEKVNK